MKTKIKPIIIMVTLSLALISNAYAMNTKLIDDNSINNNVDATGSLLLDTAIDIEKLATIEETLKPIVGTPKLDNRYLSVQSTLIDAADIKLTKVEKSVEEEVIVQEPDNSITVQGIDFVNTSGKRIITNAVTIDPVKILEVYNSDLECPEWDYKNKINLFAALWEFLVNQCGMNPEHVAGVLGNVAIEGTIAMEQGTGIKLKDIEHARKVLGRGKRGYGIVQWTYYTRQEYLLQYYELANKLYPDNWELACITAECCALYEDLKLYNVFPSSCKTVEDATGRMSTIYERYEHYENQWKYVDGICYLKSNSGSGCKRLAYANNLYDYFSK